MPTQDLLLVGRVARPHGLRGECKVIPESDDPARLLELKQIWVGDTSDAAQRTDVDSARLQRTKRGVTVLMRMGGASSVEEAQQHVRQNAYARETDLPPLQPGEFFLHELVSMAVITSTGEPVGTVKDVWEMSPNNLYVVERPGKKDALIPAVSEFVREVDRENRQVLVTPIDGLLD